MGRLRTRGTKCGTQGVPQKLCDNPAVPAQAFPPNLAFNQHLCRQFQSLQKIRWIFSPKFCTFAITEFQGYGITP
jgi:hypothetical protein